MLNMPETAPWCHWEPREREWEREWVGGDQRSGGREREWQLEGRAKHVSERSRERRQSERRTVWKTEREKDLLLGPNPSRSAVSLCCSGLYRRLFSLALLATNAHFLSLSRSDTVRYSQTCKNSAARHNWWVRAIPVMQRITVQTACSEVLYVILV